MKTLFQYDADGTFTGELVAGDNALVANATSIAPEDNLFSPVWDGDSWVEAGSPVALSKVAFMDLAYPVLGADQMAGIARYGSVMMEAKASTNPLVVAALERYQFATVFERDDVASFLDILVGDTNVTLSQTERDAIIGGWPVV